MARRKSVNFVRDVGVDPRFGLEPIQKLINVVMWRGKKNVARSIVYGALDLIIEKSGGDTEKGLEVFNRAMINITPVIEVRPRRVGGSVYQIPREVSAHRGRSLAYRWLVNRAGERSDKTMAHRLAYEIIDASNNVGNAVKKKREVQAMAEANRAFSHYAW